MTRANVASSDRFRLLRTHRIAAVDLSAAATGVRWLRWGRGDKASTVRTEVPLNGRPTLASRCGVS
jgi:hypothetical protein